MTTVFAPISIGELIDKITILEIKKQYADDDKLKNISQELTLLEDILNSINVSGLVTDLQKTLFKINQELWNIENQKRQCEVLQKFDSNFIELARSVYFKNDMRAVIKRQINLLTGSTIIEEKIYA
jgi:Skp family chaperone for outer membrane proteins